VNNDDDDEDDDDYDEHDDDYDEHDHDDDFRELCEIYPHFYNFCEVQQNDKGLQETIMHMPANVIVNMFCM
jgi:hypothetical protein